MTGPLQGIRILDLTNVLAGPFCCHQLAHMGAEVIKVEVPGSGDLARQLGADPELNERLMGVSFLAQNPGKKSVTINLKSDKGKELFKKLAASADVVVENFRPGVMDRLSVGFDTLKKIQPALVYCAISGFGQDGPMRNLPAYDQIIQGLSGIMDITGAPTTAPYRVGYPVADTVGGITAAFAIAAALAEKKRTEPRFIDVSMLESVMATMGWAVSNWLVAGIRPVPRGNDNMTASPSGTFTTGDGLLNLAANKQEQFEAVCDVLDVPELKTDPAFARRQNRLDNRAALTALLEKAMESGSAQHWCDRLNAAGVPAGEVLSVPDALDLPQISDRGMIGSFEAVPGVDRDVQLLRTGIKLDGQAPAVDQPPPELGQDNLAVFTELGLSAKDVARLKQENII
jgi:crotonobetainyl-CoA:carnitine CoA-transferase CaiB-like acyl-CoA transferase